MCCVQTEADQAANVLTVTIMRKETFFIHAESEMARDNMIKDLLDCIDFASNGMFCCDSI